jgi:hypothetical protein
MAAARIRGIKAELASLRAGTEPGGELSGALLTDAITKVLRISGGTRSPSEIQSGLSAAGREEPLNKITSTLNHLRNRGQVIRESRGQYRAT